MGIPQTIYINEEKQCNVQADLDFQNVNLDEFLADINTAKASLIAKLRILNKHDKQSLLKKFRDYEKEKLRKMARQKTEDFNDTVIKMYTERNVSDFVKFVKEEAYVGVDEKKKLQRQVQECVNLLQDNGSSAYNLDNIRSIEVDDLKMEEELKIDGEKISDLECDILYEKCRNVCMLVKAPQKSLLVKNLKKYACNPFSLLDNQDVLQRLVKCVEHYTVDFSTYRQLSNKFSSPFTRDTLKNVFILSGNREINVNHLMYYNGKAISILFGNDNRLPGSIALWNIIFIYIMAKYHPVWSTHRDMLMEEIRFIASKASTAITFNRSIHPNIMTRLEIALWYAVEVSPIAFPNSNKNILRTFKRPLYTFYREVFDENPKMDSKYLDIWEIWEYLVHRQTDPLLEAEILAQIQHYKVLGDFLVFFEGACTTRFGFLGKFELDTVLKLYTLLKFIGFKVPFTKI